MRGYAVEKGEIIPTLGTIFALGTALRAFTEPGDGVIVNHPAYYRIDRMIERCGRQVVSNPPSERDGCYALVSTSLGKSFSLTDVNHANVIIKNTGLRARYQRQRDIEIEKKIESLGIILPPSSPPGALYVPVKQLGNALFVSGQVPMRDGTPMFTGKVGGERPIEYAQDAARMCIGNMLAVMRAPPWAPTSSPWM